MIHQKIAITTLTPEKLPNAIELSERSGYPLIELADQADYDFLLIFTPDYLGLQRTADKKLAPFYIDFLSSKMQYRSQHSGFRSENLARAIGIRPSERPVIVDATAGLGRDSYILASLGYDVTMIERSVILHALLSDAIERSANFSESAAIMQHLKLINENSITWLKSLNEQQKPDIIYLDPMFPTRKKSASVKKEMATLQILLGFDMDTDELFLTALTCANKRVVVKRPRLANYVLDKTPNHSINGKTSRFDIYLV